LFLESWIDEELWVLLVFCRLWFHFKLCRLLGLLLMLLALAKKAGDICRTAIHDSAGYQVLSPSLYKFNHHIGFLFFSWAVFEKAY
jgi:hypothetical protein